MKKLFLLPVLCLGLVACGYKDPMAYHVEIVEPIPETTATITYDVLKDYKKLSIYSYGSLIESWYSGKGTVKYDFRYLDKLEFTVANKELKVKANCTYSSEAGPYELLYGGEGYSYILTK